MTAIAVLAVASLAVAGCGSDSSTPAADTSTPPAATTSPETVETTPTASETTTAAAAAAAVAVALGSPQEFSLSADPVEIPAGKATFITHLGLEGARRRASELADRAIGALGRFGPAADRLKDVARFVVERRA